MSEQDQIICEECRKIDFERVLRLDPATLQAKENQDGILIATISISHNESMRETCPLCRLFFSVKSSWCDRRDTDWSLCAYSFLNTSLHCNFSQSPESHHELDLPRLMVKPQDSTRNVWREYDVEGHMLLRRENDDDYGLFVPRAVSQCPNYRSIRSWLQFCETNHQRLCGSKSATPSSLRVIDCSTLMIEDTPESCDYAALSYVWGQNQSEASSSKLEYHYPTKLDSEQLPRVVLDAITATKRLGLKYLWIDKYCINQEDSNDKHVQINQMDEIYSGAYLTIIAAAGDDANEGLPGVGDTPRVPQSRVKVGDITIFDTMTHPHNSIVRSKWWTRGWTFQEAVLSRRRLVFTREQTYFECNAMNCYESLPGNLELLHVQEKDRFHDYIHSGIFSGQGDHRAAYYAVDAASLDPGLALRRYNQLVAMYTTRKLSYQEDSIRAFLGIIRDSARSQVPLHQLYGVPFWIGDESASRTLGLGLAWYHHFVNRDGEMKMQGVAGRRDQFPSWSWAGWDGEAKWPLNDIEYLQSHVESLYVEAEPGSLTDYRQIIQNSRKDDVSMTFPLAIHIGVLVLSPLEYMTEGREELGGVVLAGRHCYVRFSEDYGGEGLLSLFRTRGWQAVLICQDFSDLYFMIVEPVDGSFIRVGLMIYYRMTLKYLSEVVVFEKRRIRLI